MSQFVAGGIKRILCDPSGKGLFGSLCPTSSELCPQASFPFADFDLLPFTAINLTGEDNYMMNPLSPSCEI